MGFTQLVDGSYITSLRIVESMLVKVRKLIFPTDFYVLKTDKTSIL